MKKISLGSWAFSFGPYADHPIPLESTIRGVAEAGYDGIELCGFPPQVTLDAYESQGRRSELRAMLSGFGLGVSGYAADLTSTNPTVPGNHQRYLDLFERNLDLAAEIGSPMIRVDTVGAPGSIADEDYSDAMDRISDTWRKASEIGEKAGLRVAWEFEPGFVFNKPTEIVELHEKVQHRNFYVVFDTCHAYMCGVAGARQHGSREILRGGVGQFLDLLAGRIGAIHLIDSDGTLYNDETSTHRPFGEGLINFEALGPKLRAVPGVEWWTIDLSFWPDSWELMGPSLAFARNLAR